MLLLGGARGRRCLAPPAATTTAAAPLAAAPTAHRALAPCPPAAALVSRQFVDMSRIRIEGLLAAFPKLVSAGKQHTYVETENVRYLYQPIEVGAGCWVLVRASCR